MRVRINLGVTLAMVKQAIGLSPSTHANGNPIDFEYLVENRINNQVMLNCIMNI